MGAGEGALSYDTDASKPMLTLRDGAPPVHVSGVDLHGGIRVDGGDLELSACTFDPNIIVLNRQRRLVDSAGAPPALDRRSPAPPRSLCRLPPARPARRRYLPRPARGPGWSGPSADSAGPPGRGLPDRWCWSVPHRDAPAPRRELPPGTLRDTLASAGWEVGVFAFRHTRWKTKERSARARGVWC